MPICTENILKQLLKWPKILPKIDSTTEVFGYSEGHRGVSQILNTSVLIVWIHLSVVSLWILSTGLHPALLRPNLFVTRLQMTLSRSALGSPLLLAA